MILDLIMVSKLPFHLSQIGWLTLLPGSADGALTWENLIPWCRSVTNMEIWLKGGEHFFYSCFSVISSLHPGLTRFFSHSYSLHCRGRTACDFARH